MQRAFLVLAAAVLASGAETPDARDIVRRSVDRDQGNWAKAQNYTMVERKISREFDGAGKVRSTKSETRDLMFIDGEIFEHLIEKDGKPLAGSDKQKEDERFRKFTEQRQREDPARRQRRIAEGEKRRAKSREFAREIPRAYDFKLVGEEKLDGHNTWVIDATPRADFKSSVDHAWILPKFKGRLWVDKQEYTWVKIDCESIAPVKIGWFLFALNKGAHVQFEQTHVNDEVWLVKHAVIRYDARILVKRQAAEEEQFFSDFKKFSTDSRVVAITQQ